MSAHPSRVHRRPRPSITRRDLIPELGVASATVAITAAAHLAILPWFGGKPPLILFAAIAAGVTSWRGLGPGMLTSSLGAAVGSTLFIQPFNRLDGPGGNAPVETLMLFAGSMFVCWLIYRLKADQELVEAVHDRRNDALSFVSHELRQPLSNVQLAAAMLERDRSEATQERATKLILRSAARLGKVIDDLADVTRLHGQGLRIERTVLRLQEPILAAAESAGPAIEQRQQYLEVDVPLEPPQWISGDADRLQQIFTNLLSNASRYSPEGAEISISARQDDGRAVVVVRDTGIGIKRDMLERIFDPFVRESGGISGGLGIGLTLVRSLVKQHGGHISAHSDGPGRGSTFALELPLLAGGEQRHLTASTRPGQDPN
jgi:signal transduction histidine kinase